MKFCKVCGIELNDETRYKGVRSLLCKKHWNKYRTIQMHRNPDIRKKTYENMKKYAEKNDKTEKRKRQFAKADKKYYQIHKELFRVRGRLWRAVKRGEVEKLPCIKCGNVKSVAHHYLGYEGEHWKDVIWLCSLHHKDEHRRSYL